MVIFIHLSKIFTSVSAMRPNIAKSFSMHFRVSSFADLFICFQYILKRRRLQESFYHNIDNFSHLCYNRKKEIKVNLCRHGTSTANTIKI